MIVGKFRRRLPFSLDCSQGAHLALSADARRRRLRDLIEAIEAAAIAAARAALNRPPLAAKPAPQWIVHAPPGGFRRGARSSAITTAVESRGHQASVVSPLALLAATPRPTPPEFSAATLSDLNGIVARRETPAPDFALSENCQNSPAGATFAAPGTSL